MPLPSHRFSRVLATSLYLFALISGCGDDAEQPSTGESLDAGTTPPAEVAPRADAGSDTGPVVVGGLDAGTDKPVYALLWIVLGDDSTTSYVQLTDSIDTQPSLAGAREFGGWSGIAAVGGKLLVSSGDGPRISSFTVDDRKWVDGPTLSFANTGATAIDFGAVWWLDEHTAYFVFENTSRAVFDPTEMRIRELKEDTTLELSRPGGMKLAPSWHREARLTRNHITVPFYYRDDKGAPGPSILVDYDPLTHAEGKHTEVNCEGLEVVTNDESGNRYYSPWWSDQVSILYKKSPATCIARIKPDGSVEQGWPKDFLDLTGGRPVAAFQYVGNGKAVASVLHQDEGAPLGTELNPDLPLGPYYPWIFDLEKGTAHKIEGIQAGGWGFQVARFDERVFLMIANDAWDSTTAYELDREAGTVKPSITAQGWLIEWIRVK